MTRFTLTAAAAAVAAALPAFAQTPIEAMDADGDGFLSLPEALVAYPDMSATDFDRLDANQDRLLDQSEVGTGEATEFFAGLQRAEAAEAAPMALGTVDADADSNLSREEFLAAFPNVPEVYFQDFDRDNSGLLESIELESGAFQTLLAQYGY